MLFNIYLRTHAHVYRLFRKLSRYSCCCCCCWAHRLVGRRADHSAVAACYHFQQPEVSFSFSSVKPLTPKIPSLELLPKLLLQLPDSYM